MENNLSPKNFFIQIGIIASLYVSTVSFLSFIFDLINVAFPENNPYGYALGYTDSMRIAISAIIVFFPLFIWLSKIYRKSVAQNEIQEGKLRKWLLYFTLFITGLAMAIDVVVLLNAFLGGNDITTSFSLKVFSVLLVCGAIFFFYLKEIKGYWNLNKKGANIFAGVISAVVIISMIGGFIYIGSPSTQRKITQDTQRANDLSSIQNQVVNFYQSKERLPENIGELTDPISGFIVPKDPETKKDYEYIKGSNPSFELCADFALASNNTNNQTVPVYYKALSENWKHDAGRVCFSRTIDPEKYPFFSKTGNTIKTVPQVAPVSTPVR